MGAGAGAAGGGRGVAIGGVGGVGKGCAPCAQAEKDEDSEQRVAAKVEVLFHRWNSSPAQLSEWHIPRHIALDTRTPSQYDFEVAPIPELLRALELQNRRGEVARHGSRATDAS